MQISVVTGGAGFIGSHLVDALIARGDKVIVIDNLSSGLESNLSSAFSIAGDRLTLVKTDICTKETAQIVLEEKPNFIFHLAAQMNVRASVDDPIFDAEKNIIGTLNILEATRKVDGVKIIFSSTGGAIYGDQIEFPASESHQTFPESPYGVSKLCGENYLNFYSRMYNLPVVSLRYGNVYGPRQNPKGEAGVVAIFIKNLLSGKPLKVNGDGLQTRDYVYVADVVSANLLASSLKADKSFECFNVGLGVEATVLDIVEMLGRAWKTFADKHGRETTFEVNHGPALAGEQRRSVISPNKISSHGWNAKVSFEEGIKQTLLSFL